MGKIKIPTYETFSISRSALSQILNLAEERMHDPDSERLTSEDIHRLTSLGTRQVKAAITYEKVCNLMDDQGRMTPFGLTVNTNDPDLMHPVTQWLLHYRLSRITPVDPSFWTHLVITLFKPGQILKSQTVAEAIKGFHRSYEEVALAEDTYQKAATIFLRSYSKPDGLNALGILTERLGGEYVVEDVEPAPWPVVAYALADTWDRVWDKRLTINLDLIREVGSPLLIGMGTMMTKLRPMQERGWIDIHRNIPPYQITRLFDHAASFLEHLYEPDDE